MGNLDKPDKLLDEHFMVLVSSTNAQLLYSISVTPVFLLYQDNSGVEVAAKPDQLLKENFMTLVSSANACCCSCRTDIPPG